MGSSGGKNGSGESMVDEVGWARGAFELRGREMVRRQDGGQDEGGRIQGYVVRRQAQSGKRQDGGDWRQYEDERERERKGDMRQEGEDRCRGAGAQTWSSGDVSPTRESKGKGVHKGVEQVNLEDWLRRFKLEQRERQGQGGMEEYQERDCRLERRQERREERSERQGMGQDERERVRWGIGQGKGMRKGKGKCKREIDEQKDWEAWWLVKEERWANEQWVRMSDDDLDMGETGQSLRQEQWDAVMAAKLRSEMLRMAECLGEEMAREFGRGSRCRIRDRRMERERERKS